LKESKAILKFSTPWPKQSYQHIDKAITKDYDRKTGDIFRAIFLILLFFCGSLSSTPIFFQDFIIHSSVITCTGYFGILYVRLCEISQLLGACLMLIVAIVVHFIVNSSSNQRRKKSMKLSSIVPHNYSNRVEEIALNIPTSQEICCPLRYDDDIIQSDSFATPPVISSSDNDTFDTLSSIDDSDKTTDSQREIEFDEFNNILSSSNDTFDTLSSIDDSDKTTDSQREIEFDEFNNILSSSINDNDTFDTGTLSSIDNDQNSEQLISKCDSSEIESEDTEISESDDVN
jgi:hypothetical protein